MNKESEFPFKRARRVTPQENQKFREALVQQFSISLRNREQSVKEEEYEQISIQLHPQILAWAKKEAKKRGISYHTVINEALLEQISS